MAINCTKLKKPEYCILFKGIVLSIMGLIHTAVMLSRETEKAVLPPSISQ